ncbi:hypothetical protein [Achromobacter ruhlandii]|uniref:hypothetical protein n=1 Tax=Achromobacter ruhlandii TaxID=72557 RepID=UPI0012E73597|nr:hypothetical protein [Achromobacter ruhlandii]
MPPRQDRAVPALPPNPPGRPDHATTRGPGHARRRGHRCLPRLASMAKVWKRLKREAA